jgi:hypothetical protein
LALPPFEKIGLPKTGVKFSVILHELLSILTDIPFQVGDVIFMAIPQHGGSEISYLLA